MIDRILSNFFGWVDGRMKFLDKIVDDVYTFDFPNCKSKKKKKK